MIENYMFFIIYAFFGWCVEVIYAAVHRGKFVNRGFLNGPYCPVYGFGVIFVILLLLPFKDHIVVLFFGSVLITSIIELIAGYVLEKTFHHKWWDYSDRPFNIGGYICLLFSLSWGVACVLVIHVIHPMVVDFVDLIPRFVTIITIIIFTFTLGIDLIITANTVFKLNKKLERIEKLSARVRKLSEEIGESLAEGTITFVVKKGALKENISKEKVKLDKKIVQGKRILELNVAIRLKEQKETLELKKNTLNNELEEVYLHVKHRILKAFPSLKSIRYKEAFKIIEEYLNKKL